MRNESNKIHHLFLAIAIINLLAHFWLPDSYAWHLNSSPGSRFVNKQTLYTVIVSILVALIWYTYALGRKKLVSDKLILLHVLVVIVIVFAMPRHINLHENELSQPPRRYYSYVNYHSGSDTVAVIFKAIALVLSELLLLINVRKHLRKEY